MERYSAYHPTPLITLNAVNAHTAAPRAPLLGEGWAAGGLWTLPREQLAKRLTPRLVLAGGVALTIAGVYLTYTGLLLEGLISTFAGIVLANAGTSSLKDVVREYAAYGENASIMAAFTILAGFSLLAGSAVLAYTGSVSSAALAFASGLVLLGLGIELLLYKP